MADGISGCRLSAAIAAIAVISMALSGCSLQKFTADQTADLLSTGSVALDRESDLQFAREALPASLKTLETFLAVTPENKKLLLQVARGFNAYAFAFLERDLERAQVDGTEETIEELNRRAILHYMRARDYGLMLLDKPEIADVIRTGGPDEVKEAVDKLEEEDVPGLFWTGYSWASAVNLAQDNPDMVAKLPVVEVIMNRVLELDEDYFHGSPHLFFGVYYASRPPMFGGSPQKAKEHFEAAMASHGRENLLIPFMYGRFYAVQTQDRALFNKMMKRVLEAEVERYPDMRLLNEVARDRARFWVERASDVFIE